MLDTRHADTVSAPEPDGEQEKFAPTGQTSALDGETARTQSPGTDNDVKRFSVARGPSVMQTSDNYHDVDFVPFRLDEGAPAGAVELETAGKQ